MPDLEGKLRIGWYCPYTLPPLLLEDWVEDIQLVWENNNNNRVIGSTKLCSKLSALYEAMDKSEFDGFIMPSCCNLSNCMYSYFKHQKSQMPLYLAVLPKKGKFLLPTLSKEWEAIKNWLFEIRNSKYYKGNIDNVNIENVMNPYLKEPHCTQKEVMFCRLNIDLLNGPGCMASSREWWKGQLRELSLDEIAEIIIENTYCPRMLETSNITLDKRFSIDTECILQNYFVFMQEMEKQTK